MALKLRFNTVEEIPAEHRAFYVHQMGCGCWMSRAGWTRGSSHSGRIRSGGRRTGISRTFIPYAFLFRVDSRVSRTHLCRFHPARAGSCAGFFCEILRKIEMCRLCRVFREGSLSLTSSSFSSSSSSSTPLRLCAFAPLASLR
jgi:hypothetical protein